MEKSFHLLFVCALCITSYFSVAQKYIKSSHIDKNGFTYETVSNDPLNTRVYTLKNGLKVYLSVYKNEPRIQTYVAIGAGSKNDPSTATGLAHYLEHLLFKGTSKIGTHNWKDEERLIDEIEAVYEVYRGTRDENKRKVLYHEIDSLSVAAAQYAIANEYDKLVGGIGATGTNAYTSLEQTVYVNNIPSNQIENWAKIESERFNEVVPRLFHTELEAVYEEKNMGMDNDRRKVWEQLLAGLFQKHPYGTQTTIGTVEHLKNPSITEIKKYFNTYYVANNMALCMSGDFDPDITIRIIAENFGKLRNRKIPKFISPQEDPITQPIVKEVVGPNAEQVSLAFRFKGVHERESLLMELMSIMLSNGQAGLIDINLNQQQKVLGAYSSPLRLKDYSLHALAATPTKGQSLEEVRDLLLSQIELVKKGEFDDWLIKAIINDYKVSQMKAYESNKSRANAFVTAFTSGYDWKDFVEENHLLESVTKQEMIDFANKYYKDNYVVIYKRIGEDKNIKKVPKPTISKVEVNREKQSVFFKEIQANKVDNLSPVFIDYQKDITKGTLKNNIPILYQENTENQLFQLYYIVDMGTDYDKELGLAISYLNYIGNKKYNAEQLQQEFYKLGCQFDVFSSRDQVYVKLTGLEESFDQALQLFESFLKDPVPNQEAYDKFVERILKSRQDGKLNKRNILMKGMVNYAKYGDHSPIKNILSEEELKNINPDDLCTKVQKLKNYSHRILYYGPKSLSNITKRLNKGHKSSKKKIIPPSPVVFKEQEINENIVYFVNYDMVQAEIIFLSKSTKYDPSLVPTAKLFNEYFGGNMGSIVFQEMREAQALAYSVRSYYSIASEKAKPSYIVSYIGTQADKFHDAILGMQELLNNMPKSRASFEQAVTSMKSTLESDRITKNSILFSYERAKKLGVDYDIREKVYDFLKNAKYEDIEEFQEKYIKNQKQAILVIGSKENLDLKELERYGKVKELSLEQLFGY